MPDCRIIESLQEYSESDWQELDTANNPFLAHAFLYGLEKFGCLKNQHWQSAHLAVEDNGRLLALMPMYIKQDSYGEFVFDWAWADAYQRAGRPYYPKLVSAIPFTPASGHRLLVHNAANRQQACDALLDAMQQVLDENRLSSAHVLFPDSGEMDSYRQHDGMERLTIQFHWVNDGYRDFQDFTDRLSSKKRKKLLRERRTIQNSGIEIERLNGHEISAEQWQAFYHFYCATFYKKWGEPRLTLEFFQWLGEKLPDQTLLVLAKQDTEYIAGAFAMLDDTTLYGRHWGCREEIPFMHFELCYYQTIEHVIEHGMQKLDAGVQGEHKLARGFQPVAMSSAHWIREPAFAKAIADYLSRETAMVREQVSMLESHLPYKQAD